MNTASSGLDTTSLSARERKLSDTLFNLEALFREHLHENVEIQTILFFLEVASKSEAVDLGTVGNKIGLSKAAASRNFYRLSDGKGGEGGLELVKASVDYQDRRKVMMTLTPKGITAIKIITGYLEKTFRRLQDASDQ